VVGAKELEKGVCGSEAGGREGRSGLRGGVGKNFVGFSVSDIGVGLHDPLLTGFPVIE
jgi:hypothetical protein